MGFRHTHTDHPARCFFGKWDMVYSVGPSLILSFGLFYTLLLVLNKQTLHSAPY